MSSIIASCNTSKLRFSSHRGCWALVGPEINELARKYIKDVPSAALQNRVNRDGKAKNEDEFHVTRVTPTEWSGINEENFPPLTCPTHFVDLGFSHVKAGRIEAWYVALYCPELQELRRSVGLPEKDFHITLGFYHKDPHGNLSGTSLVKNIKYWNNVCYIIPFIPSICSKIIMSVSSANILSQETEKTMLEMVAVYLLETMQVVNTIEQRHTSLATKYAAQLLVPSRRVPTAPAAVEMLRDIGKCALHRQLWSFTEYIAWGLCRSGYIFGLRLVLSVSVKRFQTIYLHELLSICPITLQSQLQAKHRKIQTMTREMNELLMAYGANWIAEKRVFYYNPTSNTVEMPGLPRNFSWVRLHRQNHDESSTTSTQRGRYHYLIAGSAMPTRPDQLQALNGVGIRHIITIHEQPLASSLQSIAIMLKIQLHHIFALDRTPPSQADMQRTSELMHEWMYPNEAAGDGDATGDGILVHCLGGLGRTNTVIIAYLMRYQPGYGDGMTGSMVSAKMAIEAVGEQRKMILSTSQITFLKQDWWHFLSRLEPSTQVTTIKSAPEGRMPIANPSSNTNTNVGVDPKHFAHIAKILGLPPVLMLCGLPGSGKSTLAKALLNAYPNHFVHVNRDLMRQRGQCADLLDDVLASYKHRKAVVNSKTRKIAILDGCHINQAKRAEWLQACYGLSVWCIHFTVALNECKQRAACRFDHPTVPAGERAYHIVESMYKQYEPVTSQEGFEKVITIGSLDELQEKILRPWKLIYPWSPPVDGVNAGKANEESDEETAESQERFTVNLSKPIKFPRTCHAVNLGAATRDDKLLPLHDLQSWIQLGEHFVIEEKVDGANMGIFIRSSDQRIVIQNRSHFISPSYHPQFEALGAWLNKHSSELYDILVPDRHILYGEWCYATHSVSYDALPDYFIAYDVYDLHERCFMSRRRLLAMLASTSIPCVKLVYEGKLESVDQLLELVHGPSHYIRPSTFPNCREGTVIRIMSHDDAEDRDVGTLLHRAKLVRSDFIAGNERWNRSSKLQRNTLTHA
jgi:protein-tyrosine phosphatase/predicted kinase